MHYYSYKYHEVLKLDYSTFSFLSGLMVKAKANDDIEAIEVISFPHLKNESARNKKHGELLKRAETKEELNKRVVSSDELSMNGIKIGSIEDHIKGR